MGTPVTAEDLESAKDVPIEVAIGYLEALERERHAARCADADGRWPTVHSLSLKRSVVTASEAFRNAVGLPDFKS
jgi:hypothetical protein